MRVRTRGAGSQQQGGLFVSPLPLACCLLVRSCGTGRQPHGAPLRCASDALGCSRLLTLLLAPFNSPLLTPLHHQVVEIIAEQDAPARPYTELFASV